MKSGDIVTLLDGNQYIVVAQTDYENKEYYYLLDLKENSNFKFCYKIGNDIIELNDLELVFKLIPLMLKNTNIEL